MKKSIQKCFHFIKDLFFHFSRDFSTYFYKGWKASLIGAYTHSFVRSLIFHLNQFRIYLYRDGIQHHSIKEDKIKRLQQSVHGLHSLLPYDARFSYSILIPVDQPRPHLFQESLESALNQSAPNLEICIGFMQPPSKEIEKILMQAHQKCRAKLHIVNYFQTQEKELVINQLAENASGKFLLVLQEEDWLRPDFLFRYEQTLRIFSNPEKKVIYCNLNQISDKGYFLPNSEYRQPHQLHFPFFFKPLVEKGMLIPAALWKKVGGLAMQYKGAEYENLFLQLDIVETTFQHIPLCLYSIRSSAKQEESKSQTAFLQVLENYSKSKHLNWKWVPGYQALNMRAIPVLPSYSIQIVIPYKDQKELTMKCLQSLMKQKDIQFQITAVDNCSKDASIAQEIEQLGGEVIFIQEPFNYSRLNNLAVKLTQKAKHCNVVLFLNNDVELESDALSEMLRWIDQPQIGMVGCRLHYPDGRLQHGGVGINFNGKEEMRWEHIEKLRYFEELKVAKTLGVFDAVTAACVMMKKQIFLDVDGFDEIWYPIGYSDTNLAVKITAKGLKCFYTPYAIGVHHESVSRKSSIEDYENSWWLHHLLMNSKKFNGNSITYHPK